MTYTYKTKGTCSSNIELEVEEGIIKDIVFWGGCNGNLQGISRLVKGMPDVYKRQVGTPAEIMKYRFDENTINHIYQSKYWDYPPQKGKRIIDDIKLGILLKL